MNGISTLEKSDKEVLMEQIHLLTKMAPDEAYILYINERGIVAYQQKSARFPFPFKDGDSIDSPALTVTNTAKAWRTRQFLKAEGNPANFGFYYITKSQPLAYENGEFAGVLTIIFPSDNAKILESGVRNLSDQVATLNHLGHEMAKAGQEQAKSVEQINNRVNDLQDHASALVGINTLITEVASQTNLLGLNAAIEAARAGDLGRGFGVVADEIRRLSLTVKESSSQVNGKINEIIADINDIQQAIEQSSAGNQELSAQLQELSTSVEQVHQTSVELSKI